MALRLGADEIGQDGDALLDLGLVGKGIREPQRPVAATMKVAGCSGEELDSLLPRRDGQGGGADALWQVYPDEEAAIGVGPGDALRHRGL